jgi:hypothetical protein
VDVVFVCPGDARGGQAAVELAIAEAEELLSIADLLEQRSPVNRSGHRRTSWGSVVIRPRRQSMRKNEDQRIRTDRHSRKATNARFRWQRRDPAFEVVGKPEIVVGGIAAKAPVA